MTRGFLTTYWIVQLAVEAEELFEAVVTDLGVRINFCPDGENPIESIFDYVEGMRCSLWDIAFFREFMGPDQAHKNKTKDQQPNFQPALRRILYRYFKYVLLPRKALSRVPAFFPTYLDTTSPECMFTPAILKAWDNCHYDRCGWYLDCPVKKPPPFDVQLRDSLQPTLATLAPAPANAGVSPTATKKTRRAAGATKPRGAKRKAAVLDVETLDEDIPATTAASGDMVEKPPPSEVAPIHTKSPAPKPQPQKKPHVEVQDPDSGTPLIPPSLKSLVISQPTSSSGHSSQVLILNDTFPNMMDYKNKHQKFPKSFDDMVYLLLKVIRSILHCI